MSAKRINETNLCFQYVLCAAVLEVIDSAPAFKRCRNSTQGHIRALGQYSNDLKLHRRFTKQQIHRALESVVKRSQRFVVMARLHSAGLLAPDGPNHWRLFSTNAKTYTPEEIEAKAAQRRAKQAKATAARRAAQRAAAGPHPGFTDEERRRLREGYMSPSEIDAFDEELSAPTPPKLSDAHREAIIEYTKKRRSGVIRTSELYCRRSVRSRGDKHVGAKAPRDLHIPGDSPQVGAKTGQKTVRSPDKIRRTPKSKAPRDLCIPGDSTANPDSTPGPVAHIILRCVSEPPPVLAFDTHVSVPPSDGVDAAAPLTRMNLPRLTPQRRPPPRASQASPSPLTLTCSPLTYPEAKATSGGRLAQRCASEPVPLAPMFGGSLSSSNFERQAEPPLAGRSVRGEIQKRGAHVSADADPRWGKAKAGKPSKSKPSKAEAEVDMVSYVMAMAQRLTGKPLQSLTGVGGV